MRQDIVLMHDCTYGGCGTCRIRLLEGAVDYEEWPFALAEDEAAAGHALACQARPKGDLVIGARLAAGGLDRARPLPRHGRRHRPAVA